jgi:pimeloyl-ACP methyl ester carboxylesterase/DNA-binding CsgD family transcriptional regulator
MGLEAAPDAEQEIRFCTVGVARLAYATTGEGPALVLPAALGASHLELEWTFPEFRAFVTALARGRTVVRYDRLGTGLSDRGPGVHEIGLEAALATLEALIDALGLDRLSLLGFSGGGPTAIAYAARHSERVRALALVGAYAQGEAIAPAAVRQALVTTVRAHWGMGSRSLTDVWIAGADPSTRERFARLQRASAAPEMAAALLEAVYDTDVRELARDVDVPALVVHRRRDRAIPFACGREVAALLRQAQLVALDGEMHPPWFGNAGLVVRAITSFLDAHHPLGPPRERSPTGTDADSPLSAREAEVLRLVADGLSDRQIAERLIVSPHTVHRHLANIRAKLGQPSRAAAAAQALRRGLI